MSMPQTIATKMPKILIVEDSLSIRKTLALRLKDITTDIKMANDGLVGLKMANSHNFDLILSDVDMPNMDGLEMLRELKRNKQTRGVPTILLSFMESKHDISIGYEAGAAAYVKKTSTTEELKKAITEVLSKNAANRKSTILVVDDSLTIRRMVEAGLAKAGFQVITAANGRDALTKLVKDTPDLIISDLDMPVMNGIELCKSLRTDAHYAAIPVLIMSANSERSMIRNMIEQGASSYLVKPFNMEQLVITVEKLLSEQFQMIFQERERLERERTMMLATIASLIQALEARDAYTRGHSERVSQYASGLGKHMNLPSQDIEALVMGGKLHDLGKIGIPDNVLLKNGKLTNDEYQNIMRHPVIGADILKSIPSLKRILPIVLHHHERVDGRGYPDQLKGTQIPLLARLTGVVDTYDAITSDRPYRKGLSKEIALDIISKASGTQLCSECVEAFMDYIK